MEHFTRGLRAFYFDESGIDVAEFAITAGIVGTGSIIALKSLDTDVLSALSSAGIHIH